MAHQWDGKNTVQLSELEQSVVIACQSGQAQLVKFFLDGGVDKDMLTPEGSTLLHVAVEHGHHEVVKVLVQAGADVNKEFNGMSPLYRASELGHPEIVELLVQAGADRALSYQNLTPLLVAVQKGHMHIVQLLMSNSSQNISRDASKSAAGMVQTGVQENALEMQSDFWSKRSFCCLIVCGK